MTFAFSTTYPHGCSSTTRTATSYDSTVSNKVHVRVFSQPFLTQCRQVARTRPRIQQTSASASGPVSVVARHGIGDGFIAARVQVRTPVCQQLDL
jgi:hypothetical protein